MTEELPSPKLKFQSDVSALTQALSTGELSIGKFKEAIKGLATDADAGSKAQDRYASAVAKLAGELKGGGATEQLYKLEAAVKLAGGTQNLTAIQTENLARKIDALKAAGGSVPASLQGMTASVSGLGKAIETQATQQLSGLTSQLGPFGPALAAIGPAGLAAAAGLGAMALAGGAVGKMVLDAAAWADNIKDTAAALGTSSEGVQRLEAAALAAEVPLEQVTSAVIKMQKALETAPEKFEALGLSMSEFRALAPEQQFAAVAEKLALIEDPAARNTLAVELLGKSWKELAPLVLNGLDAMKSATVISDEQVDGLDKLHQSTVNLGAAWNKLWLQMGAAIGQSPTIVAAINSIISVTRELATLLPRNLPAAGPLRGSAEAGGFPDLVVKDKAFTAAHEKEVRARAAAEEKAAREAADAADRQAKYLLDLDKKTLDAKIKALEEEHRAKEDARKTERRDEEEERRWKAQKDKEALAVSLANAKLAASGITSAFSQVASSIGGAGGSLVSTLGSAFQDISGEIAAHVKDGTATGFESATHDWLAGSKGQIASGLAQVFAAAISAVPAIIKSSNAGGVEGVLGAGVAGASVGSAGGLVGTAAGAIFGTGFAIGANEKISTGMKAGMAALTGGVFSPVAIGGLFRSIFGGGADEAKRLADETERAKKAAEELAAATALHTAAIDQTKSAMDRYKIGVEEMGPAWAQQGLDEKAAQLMQDYRLLTAAGADHNLVIERMGPNLNEYVQTSIKAGTTIPEGMRPALQAMVDLGLLTDGAGVKIDSLDGLTFGKTMSEALDLATQAIDRLVNAMNGIPNIERSVSVTVKGLGALNSVFDLPGLMAANAAGSPGTNERPSIPSVTAGRIASIGTGITVPSMATPARGLDPMGGGGGGTTVIQNHVTLDGREMATWFADARRSGRIPA